ncbi:MAG: DEAD/DEAH box helicase, partial [Verrucomicrobia bacterium]|nr:DEAD/DEAH box helicase [Verrucomicrobiota bacterium]
MLNPILFTESVIGDFLKYQLTTYAFADPDLYAQMRRLLNLDETRHTPLLKGPYISLSRAFRKGPPVEQLVSEGILHPHLKNLIPYPAIYGHQEAALRSIKKGRTTLVSTGTGSGKTECFLYPIISRCLELKDRNEPAGIVAVIVYPMNALAEDQLGRLRDLLAGSDISFGMYVGKTPELEREVTGERLPAGSSRADYQARLAQAREAKETHAIHPPEERVSRQEMRTPGKQPRILLTNVKQLELLLTRQQDVELFDGARLEYLVFDEAHTFKGVAGAETACLIRRLRAFCGRRSEDTICVATSATLADPERGTNAAKEFASRFFGVEPANVEVVLEQYEEDEWSVKRNVPRPLPGDPREHLKNVLEAVESGEHTGAMVRIALRAMTGEALDGVSWQEDLYDRLMANELVYQIAQVLRQPRKLDDLLQELSGRLGRKVIEEELLAWLALGSVARKQGRPLLRPVVHGFTRGVEGAVVTFPMNQEGPRLWLSVEDAQKAAEKNQAEHYHPLPVMSCNTCGQHYFTIHVKDFEFTDQQPGGGDAVGEGRMWQPLDAHLGGKRVVLLDRLITDTVADAHNGEDEDAPQAACVPPSCAEIWMCRSCGTLHSPAYARCAHCGSQFPMVKLLAVRQKKNQPGRLARCVSCSATGRDRPEGFREPARPVRAITVSDVHVLALSMLQHSDHKRLLVFSDNRQDAAFQAGWMQDHARRFRLRSLMYERLRQGPVSVGDLTAHLSDLLETNDDLSRALIPEVWRVHRKEAEGVRHQEERARFLRIQVLRELTMGVKQRIGLEPWGRLKVNYRGLTAEVPFIQEWSAHLNIEPAVLAEGIAGLLDIFRRNSILLDREGRIYSRFWGDGEPEIQRGYLVLSPGVPRALKLRRSQHDDKNRLSQILSEHGETIPIQVAKRWGVPADEIEQFYEALWRVLTDQLNILVPVSLTGFRNRPLPNCTGAYQIDADMLRLEAHQGVYRCTNCRRIHLRQTPGNRCLAWRCAAGHTELVLESPDDFNLMVLDQNFLMLQPREHSAQVPAQEREQLERDFKSKNDRVNTLVATPTLELGVDIGALDSVLLRNVPPLAANYWQRVGRAGRRHRMAVNLTYARAVSHDRAYFKEPLKLLGGAILPPRFNLRNPIMIEKHVHATILTTLQAVVRSRDFLPESDRDEINAVLRTCFPRQIKDYLFNSDGSLRLQPLDVSALGDLVSKHRALLLQKVKQVFEQGWPREDAAVVTSEQLEGFVATTSDRLQELINRLWRRLLWSREQLNRLTQIRNRQGTLEPDQDALWARCDRYIKKLKGLAPRRRSEAEGVDETNTFSVLASEGFLPGYGLEVGAVTGFALVPRNQIGLPDFDLPRVSSVAVREYVPGNLIYANGNRFLPRYYHLDPQGVQEQVKLQVDIENQAV